jgi:hypothetical protein
MKRRGPITSIRGARLILPTNNCSGPWSGSAFTSSIWRHAPEIQSDASFVTASRPRESRTLMGIVCSNRTTSLPLCAAGRPPGPNHLQHMRERGGCARGHADRRARGRHDPGRRAAPRRHGRIDLAREIKQRWPLLPVILQTCEQHESRRGVSIAVYFLKTSFKKALTSSCAFFRASSW